MSDTFTVRMGIIDTVLWNQHSIVSFYAAELKKLGFKTTQFPVVEWPSVSIQLKTDDPFPGARTIYIKIPNLGDFQQTRDTNVALAEDNAALAETGKASASIFTWNLCAPDDSKDAAGQLRDLFRRMKPAGGLKLSPKISLFADAAPTLAGYPNQPPDPCKATTEKKITKKDNQGLWTVLLGIGLSVLSKGKL